MIENKNRNQEEDKSIAVAEDSRESDWKSKSFMASMFMGDLDVGMCYPFPAQDAEDKAIKTLPYSQDFRRSVDPWVRGWKRGKKSDLKLFDGSDGYSVRWSTEILEGESDFIIFGISLDGASLKQVSMRLRSETLQGRYRILLEDDEGNTWTAPLQSVSTDRWADLSLPIGSFVRTDGSTRGSGVDGSRINWVILRDVTALHTAQRGTNALLIDDLMLR